MVGVGAAGGIGGPNGSFSFVPGIRTALLSLRFKPKPSKYISFVILNMSQVGGGGGLIGAGFAIDGCGPGGLEGDGYFGGVGGIDGKGGEDGGASGGLGGGAKKHAMVVGESQYRQ